MGGLTVLSDWVNLSNIEHMYVHVNAGVSWGVAKHSMVTLAVGLTVSISSA